MSKKILFGTLVASLLTAGTALAQPVNPPTARAVPTYHVMPAQHRIAARWTSLGEVVLGGRGDRDTLTLGRQGAQLTQLKLVLKRGQAFLSGARVTFGNGETMFVDLRKRIGRHDQDVAIIDIPGRARNVASIELVPMFERRGVGFGFGKYRGRALVEVLGQRAMMPPPWARL
jgi:hypothetical protein